jgi:hypothetical protein
VYFISDSWTSYSVGVVGGDRQLGAFDSACMYFERRTYNQLVFVLCIMAMPP